MKIQKYLFVTLLALLVLPLVSASTFEVISTTYSPAPAGPGKLITVYATIKNTSNQDSGPVTITIKPEYPFSLSDSGKNEQAFSTILPQQTVLAELELSIDKAALNGTYSVEIQIKKGGQVLFGRPLSIQVIAFKPQVEIVESQQNTTTPGAILENKLFIRNVGSSVAKNIFIGTSDDRTVTTTGVVVERPIKNIGASFVFVESLEPNETKEISLLLGVDSSAEQKTHLVPIKIKFQDANRSDFEVTRYIGIRVQGDAIMDASLAPNTSQKAIPGNQTTQSINLFNLGSGTAHGIVVEVEDNPIWKIESEKKVFIGALDPDGFDSFQITAKIASDTKPGTYPIKLKFDYKDPDYQSQSIEKTVQLQVYSPQEAAATEQDGFPWGTAILIIVLLAIGYWGYKRFFAKKNAGTKR